MSKVSFKYQGNELDVFASAKNWRSYWSKKISNYVTGQVLEVGAGIGNSAIALAAICDFDRWLCLEPDAALAKQLEDNLKCNINYINYHIVSGMLEQLPAASSFDTVLYIDVIEHVEHDKAELLKIFGLLELGGHLIILVPAHQFLFSEFDLAIGHFRRYTKATLEAIIPAKFKLIKCHYLDSVGLLASLVNKWFLQRQRPTSGQVEFWDKKMLPCSFLLDPLSGYQVGKSIIGVWQKNDH